MGVLGVLLQQEVQQEVYHENLVEAVAVHGNEGKHRASVCIASFCEVY